MMVVMGVLVSKNALTQRRAPQCSHQHSRGGGAMEDPWNLRSDTIDILHTNVFLDFTSMPSSDIMGDARITCVILQSTEWIHLDFQGLQVDSVWMGNVQIAFQHVGTDFYIPATGNLGDTLDVRIQYHGNPQADASWGGVYFSSGYAFNLGVAFTSVPHNFGRVLFPCLDNFVERSTYDFHILTTPERSAYCSGMLQGVEVLNSGNKLHHWSLDIPIPSYLAGVAVSTYTHAELSYTSINGDTIPMWLAARPVDTTDMKLSMAALPDAMHAFEQRFGPYQWPRVGYVAVPFNAGAMEHATNIAYPLFAVDGTNTYQTLYAHELSHHWWGDWVTCRTASDMWLNEGWARFCEALFLEALYGEAAYREEIRSNHKNVLLFAHRNDGARYPISGIPADITYGDHVYNKGADIARTLRSYMGDSLFFQACKDWQSQFALSDASSENLRDFFQGYTNRDLTQFFDRWVFEPGFPEFRILSTQEIPNNTCAVTIGQFSHYNNELYQDVPCLFSASDAQGNWYDVEVIVSGEETSAEVTWPANFVPVRYALNRLDHIADATLRQQRDIYFTGPTNLDYAELDINTISLGGADTVHVYAENHFARVDGDYPGFRLSTDRWWSVWTDAPLDADLQASIRYYGDPGTTKYLDPDFFAYMEANNYNEDSLHLFYRPTPSSPWQEWEGEEVLTSPGIANWTGRIRWNGLRTGDYCWGVREGAVQVAETESNSVACYLNRDHLHVQTHHQVGTIIIYDAAGRAQHIQRVQDSLDLDVTSYAHGLLIVQWHPDRKRAKPITFKFDR